MEATATQGPPCGPSMSPRLDSCHLHARALHRCPEGLGDGRDAPRPAGQRCGGAWGPEPAPAGGTAGSTCLLWTRTCPGPGAPLDSVCHPGNGAARRGHASLRALQRLTESQPGRRPSAAVSGGRTVLSGRHIPTTSRQQRGRGRALSPSPFLLPGVGDAADDGAEHESRDEGEERQVDEALHAVVAEARQGLHVVLRPDSTGTARGQHGPQRPERDREGRVRRDARRCSPAHGSPPASPPAAPCPQLPGPGSGDRFSPDAGCGSPPGR